MDDTNISNPPLYQRNIMVPLHSQGYRTKKFFCPYTSISVVQEYNKKVVLSVKRDKGTKDFFVPDHISFEDFLASYVPSFHIFTDQEKKKRIAINPAKIITITKGDDGTVIDMERGVAGQGDYSYGETTKQYIVSISISEVLRTVDPYGYDKLDMKG